MSRRRRRPARARRSKSSSASSSSIAARTRADCEDMPRPCPWVGCRYHLFVDVAESGNLKLNFPDCDPDALAATCALDVAELGGVRLEDAAAFLNLTRERIRQIEIEAYAKLEAGAAAPLRFDLPFFDDPPNVRTELPA